VCCLNETNTQQLQSEIRELKLKLRERNLTIKELQLKINKYPKQSIKNEYVNNGNINYINNVNIVPYNEICIDPEIVTPEYALTGIDGVVNLLERSTRLPNGRRNFICTDISRNVFYRVNEKLQWIRDVNAKYIKDEMFPILAVLYKRASRKIEEKLDGLVAEDVSLEEKRQNLAILICFMELCSSKLHQKIINQLKNKIYGKKETLSLPICCN